MRGRAGGCVLTAVALLAACSGDDGPGAGSTATTSPSTSGSAGTEAAPTTDATLTPPTTGTPGTTEATDATGATTAPTSGDTEPTTSVTEPADATYEATIRRTTDGVPHINGDTIEDVSFGQGYANAEDHACSLADQVLKVQGRRAAAFGPGEENENVESDFAWLAIGIDELARDDFAEAPDDVTALFDAFAAGWNGYLEEVGVEGLSGWCAGEDWVAPVTGADIYSYSRSISLLASGGALTGFIASAQPPATRGDLGPTESEAVDGWLNATDLGSNGWAVGSESVTGGEGALLVANPHFPWEGERRFWEVHLTVPGEMDIYGVQLLGLPGVGIGFTDSFAWTHTVSAGNRFTAYTLDLDPEDPTSYLFDGESKPMTSKRHRVEIRQRDGSTKVERRRLWASEYGPIINFPGFGWTDAAVITYRDANIDNDEFAEQYFAMAKAQSFDEFVDAHRQHQGVPLFNTIAVSDDGRAWYADTSATPNLSDRGERLYLERLESDPITQVARDNGAVLLDGSDSRFAWEDVPGARDPGLVPFEQMPQVERADYVFNANDSFWMAHATEMLEGDYSILHGEQRTERSLRTRENAAVLSESGNATPAGGDGTFSGEELRDAALFNRASSARLLREQVLARCQGPTSIEVPALAGEDGTEELPAEAVDIGPACSVLEGWDGRYERDSEGAVLWREFLSAIRRDVPEGLDALWADPFDPRQPVETPSGLVRGAAGTRPVRSALARATQTLATAGLDADVQLGDVQYALRSKPRIGLHGGPGGDGLTNVIGYGNPSATSEPMPDPGERIVTGSDLRPDGYPVDNGTSWLMTVDFTGDGPRAWVMLTYGETGDRRSDLFDVQTQRFSDKDWRQAAFTEAAITSDPNLTEITVSST